jgi:hypothetical protein
VALAGASGGDSRAATLSASSARISAMKSSRSRFADFVLGRASRCSVRHAAAGPSAALGLVVGVRETARVRVCAMPDTTHL